MDPDLDEGCGFDDRVRLAKLRGSPLSKSQTENIGAAIDLIMR